MSENIQAALITALIGLIGLVLGIVPTYIFMRKRALAEIAHLNAKTDKTKAETEKIKTEIQSSKTKIPPIENQKEGTATIKNLSNANQVKKEYGIKIARPKRGEDINSRFEMIGTYQKKLSNEHDLQVFVVNRESQQCWPAKSTVSFDTEQKTWTAIVNIGGDPGPRTIVVAIVGQGGQALLDYYFKVVDESGKYHSIRTLMPDVIECDEVTVILTNATKHDELTTRLTSTDGSMRIRQYLQANRIRKLQLGAGLTLLPGWLCTDRISFSTKVMYLDVTKPFPFDDLLFDYIFSEHLIEHLSWSAGSLMLQECYRILKPGGIIRIATPDLTVLLNLYNSSGTPGSSQYIKWITDAYLPHVDVYKPQFVINNAFLGWWGHQFLYDGETLELALQKAGFEDITRCKYGESTHEHLRGIEGHGKNVGSEEMAIYETMVYEAKRPK